MRSQVADLSTETLLDYFDFRRGRRWGAILPDLQIISKRFLVELCNLEMRCKLIRDDGGWRRVPACSGHRRQQPSVGEGDSSPSAMQPDVTASRDFRR